MRLYAIAVTKEKEAVGFITSNFAAWYEEERQELFEIAKKASCQRYLVGILLKQSDDTRYGEFKIKFSNDNIVGTTSYVDSME